MAGKMKIGLVAINLANNHLVKFHRQPVRNMF